MGNVSGRLRLTVQVVRLRNQKCSRGECQVAKCSFNKGYNHCGNCGSLPCNKLQGAFDDPEHGDNGERLANLKGWAAGVDTYVTLTKKK